MQRFKYIYIYLSPPPVYFIFKTFYFYFTDIILNEYRDGHPIRVKFPQLE